MAKRNTQFLRIVSLFERVDNLKKCFENNIFSAVAMSVPALIGTALDAAA
ncbi:MAG: hypothetical protein ACI9LY_000086 [Arenicella sp.]|jgi:hypothetical protein